MSYPHLTQILSLYTLLIILLLLLVSCNKDQHNHPNLSTGKDLFNYHCASCHNKDGSGVFLKGMPASIVTNKNQTDIILHIKEGRPSEPSKMPVYSNMSDKEAQKIAQYLLILKNDFFNNPANKDKFLLQRQLEKSSLDLK